MKTIYSAVALGLVFVTGGFWVNSASFAQNSQERGMMEPGQGQSMMGRGMMGRHRHGAGHQGNPVRHRVIRRGGGVPAPYTNMKNPLTADDIVIKAGKKLYGEHCTSCHGRSGNGDGEAGGELSPKPANIAFIMDKWIATDPFLFWSISEGGEPLKTAMPAFKDVLSDKERWQVIHFLRAGLVRGN